MRIFCLHNVIPISLAYQDQGHAYELGDEGKERIRHAGVLFLPEAYDFFVCPDNGFGL